MFDVERVAIETKPLIDKIPEVRFKVLAPTMLYALLAVVSASKQRRSRGTRKTLWKKGWDSPMNTKVSVSALIVILGSL